MDLSKHLDKAADAVRRRNYKLATQICSQLLALQPDHEEARRCLRNALFKKAEAKPPSKLAAILGGGPHLLMAAVTRMLRQHQAAARACERYLAVDPLNESVNLRLGEALEAAGHRKSALAVYRAWAEMQPRCLPACRRAGALLYEAGEVEAALEMYEQALRVDPRDQESLKARKNLAAEGALRSSGIEEARSSRDLIRDPEAQRRLERTDRLQLSKEEIEAELNQLQDRLAENPDDLETLVRAADLHAMDRDLPGALQLLERAVDLAPERSDLAAKVGDLRIRIQEKLVNRARNKGEDAAAEQAERVLLDMRIAEHRRRVEQHPTDWALRHDLGAALLEARQLDDAIAALQQAVKDPRRKGKAHWLLGVAFWRKGMGDLALNQLQKALDATGSAGDHAKAIVYDMGCVAEELGRPDEALARFSSLLEQDIGYRDVARKVETLKSTRPS